MNLGHGHVIPRADGFKARCGGPSLCAECAGEFVDQTQRMERLVHLYMAGFQGMAEKEPSSVENGFAHRAGLMTVYIRGLNDAREELRKNNAKS